MAKNDRIRIAIVYPGNREIRESATPENNRFSQIFTALAELGVHAEPAVYHDDFYEEVEQQLLQVDGVLVWVNPIEDGHDRSTLDAMLRKVANEGVFVSTHPDIILKIGTKEVLYQTRHMGWGSDTHLYNTIEQLREELPARLMFGEVRVLKQYRGNGGNGVWKVALAEHTIDDPNKSSALSPSVLLRVQHAKRGGVEEEISLGEFFIRCQPYFSDSGKMIDQIYQPRLPEGMIRCYLVHDKVVGFGHQAINALYPAPAGTLPTDAPQPGVRLYHPPTTPEFQLLKNKLEDEWVTTFQQLLDIDTESLPILWDADFLFGPKSPTGEDSFVLCEINVSSVAPFPDTAVSYLAKATLIRAQAAKQKRK